jgi:hypothetical protein
MRCAVCGTELYNKSSKYCRLCNNKIEILLQQDNLVPHTEKMPNESLNTDLSRQESNGKGELNINVNLYRQEYEFAPYLKDEPNFGFALLGFLFPYVGLIVYFIIKEEKPLKAGSCIKGVIWGFVFSVILGFMYFTYFTYLDKQYEKQYKIEMKKFDREYELEMKKLEKELKRYGY